MYMKEASYTMEKVNDEYKLKEVVDGVAQFVGDSISSTGQGEIIGSWAEPIEVNNYYIRKNYLPHRILNKNKFHQPLKKVDSFINYLDEETSMRGLFYQCKDLTYIRDIKTSKVNDFRGMFNGCESLETIPELDFSAILKDEGDEIDTREMFHYCFKLKNIKIKNFPAKTFDEKYRLSYGMLDFSDCYNLTFDSVQNILQGICIITSAERKYSRLLILNKKFEEYTKKTYCKIIDNQVINWPIVICKETEIDAMSLYDYTKKKGIDLIFEKAIGE